MRTKVLLVAAVMLVSPHASATGAYAEQIAGAMWFVKDAGQHRAFLAIGVRFVNAGTPMTLGIVATGRCEGSGHHLKCHMTKVVSKVLENDEFIIDPAGSSASLEMTVGRHDHHVTWSTDVGAPSTYLESWSGPGYVEGWAGFYRTGWAEGALFSHDVTRADVESASIGTGAGGDIHTLLPGKDFDLIFDARPLKHLQRVPSTQMFH